MLERIEIDTSELPYKINRTKPTFLETYFQEDSQWTTFCDGIDEKLEPFESIRARWMAISLGFTLIQFGILIAIILRWMGVLDDGGNGAYILFIAAVLSMGLEYYLIKAFAAKPLKTVEETIDDYCVQTTEQWHNVGFKFEQSMGRSFICWDSEKMSVWINVAIDDTVA